MIAAAAMPIAKTPMSVNRIKARYVFDDPQPSRRDTPTFPRPRGHNFSPFASIILWNKPLRQPSHRFSITQCLCGGQQVESTDKESMRESHEETVSNM